jgi:hypothetical protein
MKRKVIGGTEYSEAEVRRLKRYVCGLCDHRLSRETCGHIFPNIYRCSPDVMAERRDECLAAARGKA